MTSLFTDLLKTSEEQKKKIETQPQDLDNGDEDVSQSSNKQEKKSQKSPQINKDLDKDLNKDAKKDVSKDSHKRTKLLPTADVVEEMVFRMRKEPKIRINADMPEAWKKELDTYAHEAGVGKYHLVMYAVGKMLGKM